MCSSELFNGREPDQHRWNLDLGRMDSLSARVWYRPTASWELQASTGHLIEPEQLHGGNVERTTASASYMSGAEDRFTAASFGFGMNATDEVTRHAVFGEATVSRGRLVGSLRLELVEVESELLRTGALPTTTAGEAAKARVGAFTLGAVRDVVRGAYGTFGLGANLTAYAVPSVLQSTHGSHPVSFQVFAQLRPAAGAMGRMWNMRMAGPPMPMPGGMAGHRTR